MSTPGYEMPCTSTTMASPAASFMALASVYRVRPFEGSLTSWSPTGSSLHAAQQGPSGNTLRRHQQCAATAAAATAAAAAAAALAPIKRRDESILDNDTSQCERTRWRRPLSRTVPVPFTVVIGLPSERRVESTETTHSKAIHVGIPWIIHLGVDYLLSTWIISGCTWIISVDYLRVDYLTLIYTRIGGYTVIQVNV